VSQRKGKRASWSVTIKIENCKKGRIEDIKGFTDKTGFTKFGIYNVVFLIIRVHMLPGFSDWIDNCHSLSPRIGKFFRVGHFQTQVWLGWKFSVYFEIDSI